MCLPNSFHLSNRGSWRLAHLRLRLSAHVRAFSVGAFAHQRRRPWRASRPRRADPCAHARAAAVKKPQRTATVGFACFTTNAATLEVPASTCQVMTLQVCGSARWRGLRPEQRASARHCGCEVAYGIARAPMSTCAHPQTSAPLQTETCSHARAQAQLDLREELYACTGTSSPVIPRYCEERS